MALGACQTLKLAGLRPAPADECEFMADYMRDAHELGDPLAVDPFAPRPGHTAIILEPVASSAQGVDPPRWYAAAPAPETQADLNSKVASVRLDTCPGLQRQLRSYGWSFRPPPHAKTGWYWGFTRVGFNAAHTQASISSMQDVDQVAPVFYRSVQDLPSRRGLREMENVSIVAAIHDARRLSTR